MFRNLWFVTCLCGFTYQETFLSTKRILMGPEPLSVSYKTRGVILNRLHRLLFRYPLHLVHILEKSSITPDPLLSGSKTHLTSGMSLLSQNTRGTGNIPKHRRHGVSLRGFRGPRSVHPWHRCLKEKLFFPYVTIPLRKERKGHLINLMQVETILVKTVISPSHLGYKDSSFVLSI